MLYSVALKVLTNTVSLMRGTNLKVSHQLINTNNASILVKTIKTNIYVH